MDTANDTSHFQAKLDTQEITNRLSKDSSILNKYRNTLNDVLNSLSANGASYKKLNDNTLRVCGCNDRVVDFTNDKIISYYAYGDNGSGEAIFAFFNGNNFHYDRINMKTVYFDVIRCEYDLNNKTYKIFITLNGKDKEIIFKGKDAGRIKGIKNNAHRIRVVIDDNEIDMANNVDDINNNFKKNNFDIETEFVDPKASKEIIDGNNEKANITAN